MKQKHLVLGAGATVAIAAVFLLRAELAQTPAHNEIEADNEHAAFIMPEISGTAAVGRTIFENTCAACHGVQGVGTAEAGPPLIHKIYEPSHHGDDSFQRAVANGVRAHHWQFGDMPPLEGLTRGDVAMVIDYIREIQRANGIN